MPTLEDPIEQDQPVEDGTFVIIRLDPCASVAALGDAQATNEASLIKPRKCLALFNGRTRFVSIGQYGGHLTVELILAGRNLPAPPTSWASIPISPAPAHPETGRPAVRLTTPLPARLGWGDCHIHSVEHHAAVVSRIHTPEHPSSTPGPSYRLLDDNAWHEVQLLAASDRRDHPHPPPGPHYEMPIPKTFTWKRADGSEDPTWSTTPPPTRSWHSSNTYYTYLGDFDISSSVLMSDYSPPAIDQRRIPEMRPHVELWVDLDSDSGSDIADPDTFRADFERLREIERTWSQRFMDVLVNTANVNPATQRWVEEGFKFSTQYQHDPIPEDNLPVHSDGGREEEEEDDDDVYPEDAIEYRVRSLKRRRDVARRGQTPSPPASDSEDGSSASESSSGSVASTSEVSSISSSFASRIQRSQPEPAPLLVRTWLYPLVLGAISRWAHLHRFFSLSHWYWSTWWNGSMRGWSRVRR